MLSSIHTADQSRESHAAPVVLSKLNEREKKQAALPISVFGIALVRINKSCYEIEINHW